jgi:mevalonate pyrophosphate decarboxylase
VRSSTYRPGRLVVTSLPVPRYEQLAFAQGHGGTRALCYSSSHVLSVRTCQRAVCKALCLAASVSCIATGAVRIVPCHQKDSDVVKMRDIGRLRADSACRNAAGILVVYDMTDRASFDRAIRWLTELPSTMPADTVLVLVGT